MTPQMHRYHVWDPEMPDGIGIQTINRKWARLAFFALTGRNYRVQVRRVWS